MILPKKIFRAYDIRGLLHEVTPTIARQVGAAVVKKTGAKQVVVGRDMRQTSAELARAAIDGIISTGADVRDIGLCTTSMFNFAVSSYADADAGVMITASHNPAQYNGIKMAIGSGEPIAGQEILEIIESGPDVITVPGRVYEFNVLSDYLQSCFDLSGVSGLRGTKIVADYGNGMASISLRPLLQRLGVEVFELYPEPDANFPNHEANPAKEETLTHIKKKVVEIGADFGIATDGDGDRLAFIDEKGQSIRGDQTLAILAKSVLRQKPGAKVIVSPNHGWAATDMIRECGAELLSSRVGRTFIIKLMKESQAALSGEVSSHFYFEQTHGLESIDFAFLLVAGIWKESGKTFSELTAPLRVYINSGEINCEVKDKDKVLSTIEKTYAHLATSIDRTDGLRCEFGRDWWFIVRPSNTEPVVRFTFEAVDMETLEKHRDEIMKLITKTYE